MKFDISSNLRISSEDISRLFTMDAVNRELGPLIRMTVPRAWADKPIAEWPTGRVLFSSWILLFGVLPVDRHTFFFQRIHPQQGFLEASSSFANAVWRHQREITRSGAFCRVTDTVEFQPRLPFLGRVLAPVYRFIFRHRHQVLRSHYDVGDG